MLRMLEAPLVDVENLQKSADRDETVWAVNGVSFKVMPGEVLCIIAESGSGKSVPRTNHNSFAKGRR